MKAGQFLNPAEAARRLGVSAKALRLYEARGLVTPLRNALGWRTYGPAEMARAAAVIGLRALGLSLAQVARVLGGDAQVLAPALAEHQANLEARQRQLGATLENVRKIRAGLACGRAPAVEEIQRLSGLTLPALAFTLPWPWGGEPFELREIRSLNYIIGPLGSGKTRFAQRLAEILPDAAFLGLERLANSGASSQALIGADPILRSRIDQTLGWLVEAGAAISAALLALLVGLESDRPAVLVVDMIEQGLDEPTQLALSAFLRRHWASRGRPLFLLTRSSAVLDLTAVGADEAIILCPANHSPPTAVAPYSGAPGYEVVASCLASPAVRARTEGVIAWRPNRHDTPDDPISPGYGQTRSGWQT